MKKITYIMLGLALTGTLSSCHDWLTDDTPGTTKLTDFFTSIDADKQAATAAYVPLMWEYGSSTTYYPEWFVGDVVSDDALKGGQGVTDMAAAREMENFKTSTNNVLLLGYYRAQWQGISRANLAIQEIPNSTIAAGEESLRNRLVGEAKYLRAYYYFRLVRMFGGMPLIDYVIDTSAKWAQKRATRDETYQFILKDLEAADTLLWDKSKYGSEDLGRATKGAADAMLLKVNLYRAGFLAQEGDASGAKAAYEEAKKWGAKVIASGQYALLPDYASNFLLTGENGKESVFEIQYSEDPTSDYGEGEGFSRGTFTLILTRSRSATICGGSAGWGFNKPTQNLYDEFEPNDPRLDATILNPTDDQIETPAQEIYLGDRYCAVKYDMYKDNNGAPYKLTHDSRGPVNNRQIRYSDVLLMYAEACCELGDAADLTLAKNALNQVRSRAGMQAFPYTSTIQGKAVSFADNQNDLRTAIRHERRVELGMEGHRWFDLCRWGIAKETMDNYIATETDEAKAEYGNFQKGKNELFPIPSKEIDLTGIEQNPNW
jgi:hypothetical protein